MVSSERVKILQASTLGMLEKRINEFLSTLDSTHFVDCRVSFNLGVYYAVITYTYLEDKQNAD